MLRKITNLLTTIFLVIFVSLLTSCSSKNRLLLLNWGEYIDMDLVAQFEKEYNCEVIISLADSNDLFYSKVKSGTTVYDLVVPSDYMVEKMYKKGMLEKIDYQKLGFNTYEEYENTFIPSVKGIIKEINDRTPGINNYFVPYFCGTWCLMYNKLKTGLVDSINKAIDEDNVWKVFFEKDSVPKNTKIGMYDTARYAYAASMFYNKMSPNACSEDALETSTNTLSKQKFTSWATDTLKKDIANNNLDLGFMWTGDFLDMLYLKLQTTSLEDITFDVVIPDETIAFCDNLVLLKKARHKDLALKFINFFLRKEVAYQNASIVGYCTPINSAYDEITKYKNSIDEKEFIELYNSNGLKSINIYNENTDNIIAEGIYEKDSNEHCYILNISKETLNKVKNKATIHSEESDLDPTWLCNWAYAVNKYYPKYVSNEKGFTGTVLSDFPREYIDKINIICNNVRA